MCTRKHYFSSGFGAARRKMERIQKSAMHARLSFLEVCGASGFLPFFVLFLVFVCFSSVFFIFF